MRFYEEDLRMATSKFLLFTLISFPKREDQCLRAYVQAREIQLADGTGLSRGHGNDNDDTHGFLHIYIYIYIIPSRPVCTSLMLPRTPQKCSFIYDPCERRLLLHICLKSSSHGYPTIASSHLPSSGSLLHSSFSLGRPCRDSWQSGCVLTGLLQSHYTCRRRDRAFASR